MNGLSEKDEFYLPEVGQWSEDKHQKISYYSSLFAKSMRNKWDCRLYLDLFAGAGKARVAKTGEIIPGSPLVALGQEEPFDKYIFCEANPESANALQQRVNKYFPQRDVSVYEEDCNESIEQLLEGFPKFNAKYRGLTFCFVDPYNTQNLKFNTLRKISASLYVDFVVLIPSYMDIRRNAHNYTLPQCSIVDDFLGSSDWRTAWENKTSQFKDFGVYIADCFGKQMAKMGYYYESPEEYVIIRKGQEKSLYLYHLGFFSRDKLGVKFWKETRERTSVQMDLI